MPEKQGSHIEVDRLLASFDDDDDTLSELLDRMGLLAYIEAIEDEGERAKVRAEVIDKLKSALEEINKQPINQGQAKLDFIHF
jgi:hypothetical protein